MDLTTYQFLVQFSNQIQEQTDLLREMVELLKKIEKSLPND